MVVHEQNARPGLANRLGARRAAAVGVTFPGTPLPGATVVGLPLRPAIARLQSVITHGIFGLGLYAGALLTAG